MNLDKNKINNLIEKTKKASINGYTVMKELITRYALMSKEFLRKTKEKGMKILEGMDFSCLKKVHFNFHHFTTVCIVSLIVFFVTLYSTGYNTATVDAQSMSAPVVSTYNKKAVSVNYGDNKAVANVAKDILADQVSVVSQPVELSSTGMSSTYKIDNYIATINVGGDVKLGETTASVTVETEKTYGAKDTRKIEVSDSAEKVKIEDGAAYTYKVKLHLLDTEAPVINVSSNDISIDDTDGFNARDFVVAVTDNVDGIVNDVAVENDIARVDGKLEAGKHVLTFRAKDSSGNETAQEMIVRVYETEASAPVANPTKNNGGNAGASNVGSFAGAGSIAGAALAQVGVYQDCTALVSNSLAAVGIYFHGWPAGYLSLGTVVPASQAQVGDVIYYADGGLGMAHVAIYIGGGQAVHGGWLGNRTVVTSAYVGSGPVFIRINR